MNIKRLFTGLAVAGSLASTAYAGILPYLPKAPFGPNGPVIRVLDEKQELRARRLCLGKYRNVGRCKDGEPTDPDAKQERDELDTADRENLERELEQSEEVRSAETTEDRDGSTEVDDEIKADPEAARQPEQTLE
jgi:hypothetical protein